MTTPIAAIAKDKIEIRGTPIERLIEGELSYSRMILFILLGHAGSMDDNRPEMIDALLKAWVDHGGMPPSTQNVLNAASCGVPFASALASGLSCFGVHHAPVEECVKFLQNFVKFEKSPRELENWAKSISIVPGLGHPFHSEDPRIDPLSIVAERLGFLGEYCRAIETAQGYLFVGNGTSVPINLAGITAAIWLDMGLPADAVGLIPVAGRAVGLAAHYAEQRKKPAFRGITKS